MSRFGYDAGLFFYIIKNLSEKNIQFLIVLLIFWSASGHAVEYSKITQITNSETWCQIIAVILTAE